MVLNIWKDGMNGSAIAGNIQSHGLIMASLNVDKEKAIRRIRTYSGTEIKGKELFNQLNIRRMEE